MRLPSSEVQGPWRGGMFLDMELCRWLTMESRKVKSGGKGSARIMNDYSLNELLVCPRHLGRLVSRGDDLECSVGCRFPVVEGIPVLLLDDVEQTLWVAKASLEKAKQLALAPAKEVDACIDTLGISGQERSLLAAALRSNNHSVDPVVAYLVGATNGILYRSLIGRLFSYPIPELRLPSATGALFLDIGCNWGRWCIAAGQCGYSPIGIDPSLGAVLAARRLCRELGVSAQFVVGDSRYLPFAAGTFEVVFSYSVLQHFSKSNAGIALAQIARVLQVGGRSMIQMPNAFGIRSVYHQARRGFRRARDFEVRYWTRRELTTVFQSLLGPTLLQVDCFFGLGIQDTDEEILPVTHKLVVRASRLAKSISQKWRPLQAFADSIYALSIKTAAPVPLNASEVQTRVAT